MQQFHVFDIDLLVSNVLVCILSKFELCIRYVIPYTSNSNLHFWPMDGIAKCLIHLAIVDHEDCHFKCQFWI